MDGRARRAARSAGAAVAGAARDAVPRSRPSRWRTSPRRPRRIRLGTGIIILPQRNPLVLAKELASVDVVSNGRLIFGIGIGYLKPEFDALGIPFDHKGARTIEYLDAMLAMWTQPQPRYDGASSASRASTRSRARSSSRIRRSSSAAARPRRFGAPCSTATAGTASRSTSTATGACHRRLAAAEREHGAPGAARRARDQHHASGQLDADTVQRFADLGVHRLIVSRRAATEADLLAGVDKIAELQLALLERCQTDWEMFDAADEARLQAFHRAGELEVLNALDQLAKQHLQLQPRQMRSEANVFADAEPDVQVGVAVDAEGKGLIEHFSSRLADP